MHSHTFWADGSFNSYDQHDNEVDAGPYTFINGDTIHLCSDGNLTCAKNDWDATLHYRILNGDEITFDVVIPENCSTKQCQAALGWALPWPTPARSGRG